MMQHLSHIKHTDFKKIILPLIVIAIVAIGGTYLLLSSHAASPYTSVTADSGTLASGAIKQACSGSIDGNCVTFGSTAGSGGGSGPGTQTDCFKSPGACGYPDPAAGNVGSTTPCTSLPSSGSITASTSGQTIQNLNITGGISVEAPNVTINNVCVTDPDSGDGAIAVSIGSNATNLLIEHTTVSGSESQALDTGIWNAPNTPGVTANYVYIYNAAEDWHGSGTITNSYMQAGASYSGSHNEDIYLSDTAITLTHNTLLNSTGQTAVLFGDNDGGSKDEPADNKWTVKDNLMAGGGYMMYLDAQNSNDPLPVGSSTMDIENNRFARCLGTIDFDGDGHTCAGLADGASDGNGYFPCGGYYNGPEVGDDRTTCGAAVDDYCTGANQIWSDNVWDDDNSTVSC